MKNNEYEKDEEKKEVLDLMEENLSLQEVMRLALYMDCLENDAYNIAIVLLPVLISFIYFNKPKANLYMGDTGSILLGYIVAFCLLELISSKYWYLSISLYCYPIIDCSLTILKKIYSGTSVFNRNFSYFFQIPIKKLQRNNYKVLGISIIYNLFNLFVIFLTLYLNNPFLVILSIILSFIKIYIFLNLK